MWGDRAKLQLAAISSIMQTAESLEEQGELSLAKMHYEVARLETEALAKMFEAHLVGSSSMLVLAKKVTNDGDIT